MRDMKKATLTAFPIQILLISLFNGLEVVNMVMANPFMYEFDGEWWLLQ